ncbi:MAG: hypothetical protein LBD03_04780 [Methanobrevibacter sp.]|jgi:hypothetical protein|nr:hypothetical protein [Candidatus Methanovirga procula]
MSMVETTIKIENSLLKSIKKIAIDKNTTQNHLMNEYLEKGLKNELKQNLGATLEKQNNEFRDMIGIVKAKEPTNAVELKKKGQKGEY